MFIIGQAWAQAHSKPTLHELLGLSLPMCSNPILKHFLPACLSLAASHTLPKALPSSGIILFQSTALWGHIDCLVFAWSYHVYFIFPFDVEHPKLQF